ncbi:phage tail protein (plasmid) [Agrobacterium rosae]|uniref:Phage tail protein n=1 Tax=Agrobacterium rosae TaxID=1972867 RepID=A0ABU4W525_9HYPH|nr:phage tail protein [Agrobacterium rosae]MDX8332885.1 phage tail protein [Agrobacterium rosae]
MKFLLLLLATAFFVMGSDQAHAAPVVAAIGAIASAIAKLGVIGKLLIGVALSVGQSLLSKALAKKNKETTQPTGVDLSVSMGDDVPLSFTVGTAATGGKRKYIGTWGSDGNTPNAYLVDVIELENLPSSGLAGLWAGDTKCTILWNQPHPNGLGFPVDEYRRGGADYLWVKFADGSQTVADAYLREKFGNNVDRGIDADMIGRGCGYAILTCRYNSDVFSGGLPDWAFEMVPRKFYDLRKDSTNGGNGPQRWGDPSTWASTSNVVTIAYNIIRGISYGDEWVYGGQNLAAFRLPPSNWIAGANECDAAILLANGTTEPAFRCGLEINVDREPLAVLEELEKAGNMRIAEVGGIFKVLVGAPGAAVYSFTDADVIITESQSLAPFPSLNDTFNGIEATYPEPAEKWASKDAPARYDADLEAEDDNNRLPAGIAYDAVPFANQVQRLMVAMIQDYRRFRVHQFHLPPDAYPLEPNDVVSWTSEHNGYAEKKFLVTAITGQRTFNRLGSFKEIDPSDNDWSTDLELPTTTGWIGKISPPAQIVAGWQVEPAIIQNSAGTSQRPSIKVSCAPDRDGVTHVWVKVRLASDKTVVFDSDAIPYAEPFAWKLNGTFTPKTDYEVSGEFVSEVNQNQQRSEWLLVTTPNALISTFDVFDDAITATKIADGAVSANKLMDAAVTALKLADQAVSTAKLQVGAVTKEIVANGAIIADKIANGAIEAAKFAAGIQPVTIVASGPLPVVKSTDTINYMGELYTWNGTAYTKPETGIADGSVTAAKLADAAVTAAKLASQAVTNDKIAANSIYGTVIAAGAITARELVLTDFTNIYPDPNFLSTSFYSSPDGGVINFAGTSSAGMGTRYMGLNNTAADVTARSGMFPIQNNAEYYVDMAYGISTGSGTGTTEAILELYSVAANGTTTLTRSISLGVKVNAVWTTKATISVVTTTAEKRAVLVFKRYAGGATIALISAPLIRLKNNASLIVDGAIIASKLAVDSVTANAIAANAVTAAAISAGAISADKLQANIITARELALTDFTNLVPNASFGANLAGWEPYGPGTISAYSGPEGVGVRIVKTDVGEVGLRQLPAGLGGVWTTNPDDYPAKVSPGDVLRVKLKVTRKAGTAASGNIGIAARWINQNNTIAGGSIQGVTGSVAVGATVEISNVYTVPANVKAMAFIPYSGNNAASTSSDVVITDISITRMNKAELIVDGSITTVKLDALAVTAEKIAALAITAEKIAASAITADKIAASAVTADKVAANSITGDKMVANSISARELLITDFTNLIQNWDFSDPSVADMNSVWSFTQGVYTLAQSGVQGYYNFATGAETNANQLVMDRPNFAAGSAATDLYITSQNLIPVTAGETLAWEIQVRTNDVAATLGLYYRLLWFDAAGVAIGSGAAGYTDVLSNTSVPAQYGVARSGKAVVPAAARYCRVRIYHYRTNTATRYFIFDRISLRRANAGSLIVDGSITAGMIAANSITADKMNVTSLAAISANLGNVNIENAIIGNLQVDTSNIAPGAISAVRQGAATGITAISITVDHGLGSPNITLFASISGQGNSAQDAVGIFNLNSATDNTTLETLRITSAAVAPSSPTCTVFSFFTPPAGRISTTFTLAVSASSFSTSTLKSKLLIMVQKR